MKAWIKSLYLAVIVAVSPITVFAAVSIPFTVNLSEVVTVNIGGGTPRIAVDVGGVTRYATYTSGTGTSALTFTYDAVIGDVDLDGVALTSPIDLNGGTIKDNVGNDANLTFTLPNTSGIKVNYPSLSMDFVYDADGRYTLNGTAYNDLSSFLTATGGTFNRASIGTYFDNTGTLRTASANTPRFDYDPVTLTPKGILIEESRTNRIISSENFSVGGWNKDGANVTIGGAAPDGYNSSTVLSQGTGNNRIYHFDNTGQTGSKIFSIFVKPNLGSTLTIQTVGGMSPGGSTNINASTGTVTGINVNARSTLLSGGWYRLQIPVNVSVAGGNSTYWQILGPTSGIFIWGAQLEQGAFLTSYIPTTTAAVTRAADNLSIGSSGISSSYNALTSSVFSQFDYHGKSSTPAGVFVFSDSTPSNRFGSASGLSGSRTDGFVISANVTTGTLDNLIPTTSSLTSHKFSLGIMQDGFAGSGNGGAVVTDNFGTVPLGINRLDLGFFYPTNPSSNYLNGHIQIFKYYPLRVSNAQLQLLSQ